MTQQFYTVEQVAAKVHIVAESVRRAYRQGRIKGSKPGKRLLFTERQIMDYIGSTEQADQEMQQKNNAR